MLIEALAGFYRLLPIKGGQTRLSFNSFVNRLMDERRSPLVARLWDGSRMKVDPQDYHGRILYLFGTNDIKVSLTANALLRSGDVFLDIGANYSTIGLYAARAVGRSGAVHLFEPQRRIADCVAETIASAGHSNVTLHRCGLLDVDTTLTIRGPAGHSGRATFAEHESSAAFEAIEECAVHEIGRYVGPLVAGRPFGVKLDIEGAETRVMPWLLAQPNLRFLIFEANHQHDQLYEMVQASGLALYGLERRPLRLRLGRIDTFEQLKRFHDVVAVRVKDRSAAPAEAHPDAIAPLLNSA